MNEQETTVAPEETEVNTPEVTETPVETETPEEVTPEETEEVGPGPASYHTSTGAPVREVFLTQ